MPVIEMPWSRPQRPLADDSGLRKKAPALSRREAGEAPPHRKRRSLLSGSRPEPSASYLGTVEDPEEGKLGICCSGGGIRSAAFSLGALQVLQEEKELRRAAYLAAVSGGSYIAAAISMVAKPGDEDSDQELLDEQDPFAPGSPEEQYLRNRSSYMAPTGSDMLYAGIRIVLGLVLNLAFISLFLVGVTILATGLLYAPHVPDLAGQCRDAKCAANLPPGFWLTPLLVGGLGALSGFATLLFRWRRDAWERFFATWATRLLIGALGLAVVLVGLPYLVDWLDHIAGPGNSVKPSAFDTVGSISAGFLALLAGVVAQIGRMLTAKDGAGGGARKALGKLGKGASLALAYTAGAVIGPLLLLAVVALTMAAAMSTASKGGGVDLGLTAIGFGALLLFAGIYSLVDLTTWSLHPFYKRRLSSAFALKRVRVAALEEEERERVEPLEPAGGGIALERNYDEQVPISKTAMKEEDDRDWPTLLVCAAANISDSGATPPGRRVTSFTFSANSVGGPLVGAVKMVQLERAFEDRDEARTTEATRGVVNHGVGAKLERFRKAGARRQRRRDLTLPAAVAMSGAAVSPSMGKMTKRPLTFLMALANLRLGVWVPNPRWVAEVDEDEALPRKYAKARPSYLVRELLGLNRVDAKYLYVTDGGHYENLGLVELLRRGCTEIYCFDASGVGQGHAEFGALGDAIALARSELNVEIDFGKEDPADLEPDKKTHLAKKDVVRGKIRYRHGSEVTEGTLIYVRNAMTDQATWDARAHQMEDPRFPHNSTLDQLYTDQKFESYRVLGARAAGRAVEAMRAS